VVNRVEDLPAPISLVHTIPNDTAVLITTHLDLGGTRIVFDGVGALLGTTSETSSITSTGLASNRPLIGANGDLPIQNITIEDVAIGISLNNVNSAFDWFGVNFVNVASSPIDHLGSANVVITSSLFSNCGQISINNNTGTFSFDKCLFIPTTGKTAILVGATANFSRRFRITDSAFVVAATSTGIDFNVGATVGNERYILDTVDFSGAGTYLTGVDATSNKANFQDCTGIANTAVNGQVYFVGNTTDTVVAATNTFYKVAGTTTASSQNSKVITSDNRITIDAAVRRKYYIVATLSFNSGNNNVCEFGFYDSTISGIRIPSRTKSTANAAGRSENITIQCVVDLVQGDYIEVWAANTSAVTTIRVTELNFVIYEI